MQTGLIFGAIGLALAGVGMVALSGGSSPAPAHPQPPAVRITEQPHPATPRTVPVLQPESPEHAQPETVPADPVPDAAKEERARLALEELRKFDGLADDDFAGRVRRLRVYLVDHGQSQAAAEARALIAEWEPKVAAAKPVLPAPTPAQSPQPQTPGIGEIVPGAGETVVQAAFEGDLCGFKGDGSEVEVRTVDGRSVLKVTTAKGDRIGTYRRLDFVERGTVAEFQLYLRGYKEPHLEIMAGPEGGDANRYRLALENIPGIQWTPVRAVLAEATLTSGAPGAPKFLKGLYLHHIEFKGVRAGASGTKDCLGLDDLVIRQGGLKTPDSAPALAEEKAPAGEIELIRFGATAAQNHLGQPQAYGELFTDPYSRQHDAGGIMGADTASITFMGLRGAGWTWPEGSELAFELWNREAQPKTLRPRVSFTAEKAGDPGWMDLDEVTLAPDEKRWMSYRLKAADAGPHKVVTVAPAHGLKSGRSREIVLKAIRYRPPETSRELVRFGASEAENRFGQAAAYAEAFRDSYTDHQKGGGVAGGHNPSYVYAGIKGAGMAWPAGSELTFEVLNRAAEERTITPMVSFSVAQRYSKTTPEGWLKLEPATLKPGEKRVIVYRLEAADAGHHKLVNVAPAYGLKEGQGQDLVLLSIGCRLALGAPDASPLPTAPVTVVDAHPVSARFLARDEETRSAWKNAYGKDGFVFPGVKSTTKGGIPAETFDLQKLPAYVKSFTGLERSTHRWATVLNPLAELDPPDGAEKGACADFSVTTFRYELELAPGEPRRVSLYMADYDQGTRAQIVEAIETDGGKVLDRQELAAPVLSKGVYLSWELSGRVTLRFTRTAGFNAVCSAIFFDPLPISGQAPELLTRVSELKSLVEKQQWNQAVEFVRAWRAEPGFSKIPAAALKSIEMLYDQAARQVAWRMLGSSAWPLAGRRTMLEDGRIQLSYDFKDPRQLVDFEDSGAYLAELANGELIVRGITVGHDLPLKGDLHVTYQAQCNSQSAGRIMLRFYDYLGEFGFDDNKSTRIWRATEHDGSKRPLATSDAKVKSGQMYAIEYTYTESTKRAAVLVDQKEMLGFVDPSGSGKGRVALGAGWMTQISNLTITGAPDLDAMEARLQRNKEVKEYTRKLLAPAMLPMFQAEDRAFWDYQGEFKHWKPQDGGLFGTGGLRVPGFFSPNYEVSLEMRTVTADSVRVLMRQDKHSICYLLVGDDKVEVTQWDRSARKHNSLAKKTVAGKQWQTCTIRSRGTALQVLHGDQVLFERTTLPAGSVGFSLGTFGGSGGYRNVKARLLP